MTDDRRQVLPKPVPLDPPARILEDWDEFNAAVHAAKDATHRFHPGPQNLDHGIVEEMVTAALAVAGVFTPPPALASLDPECCTALCLPYDAEQFDAEMFGVWQQCGEDPGHDGDHEGDVGWADGLPGTMPARPVGDRAGRH
ncbi:hypothetical protein ABZ656_37745 [Streptomyces sp. NPDC007095]|uniref:hypothetical protein n=1 Tax=Streptomyces sp. NPDC007095 TaxID=3154482 RepID=UPI0033FEBE51